MNINWNDDVWSLLDSYFENADNYLAKNQIDSYNTFLKEKIPKTLRQFNPIYLPYSYQQDTDSYLFELSITIGGSLSEDGEIFNDGKGIYIGKPAIQEISNLEGESEILVNKKTLYPNEARLKNLTYKTDILVDIIIDIKINDRDSRKIDPRIFRKIPLGNIPIMLHSRICSLFNITKDCSRIAGECMYDPGGYFILDGKEKVIVSQERQVENKIYTNKTPKDDRYKFVSEIRSSPETKFQPARVSKLVLLKEKINEKDGLVKIQDNIIRVVIPQIEKEVPLFILYRALGVISDRDILKTIIPLDNSYYNNNILKFLRPSISEGSVVTNTKNAIDFLTKKISPNFLNPNAKLDKAKKVTIDLLRNHFIPHVGTNFVDKVYFLSYMVKDLIEVANNFKVETDRDSYRFKRIDNSGFLMSTIFRDLYFRVRNRLMEIVNVAYSKGETSHRESTRNENEPYWEKPEIFRKKSANEVEERIYTRIENFIGDNEDNILHVKNIISRDIIDDGFNYAFKNCWGLKFAPCKEGVVQDVDRISYLGFISHLRRINTPLSSSAKIRAPHSLHLSSWGFICPHETPDGGNIGLRKNLAILSEISSGTNSKPIEKCLIKDLGVEDIKQPDENKINSCLVFLNERLIGYTYTPISVYHKLKLLKRNALINIYTSIIWNTHDNNIKISTDSGRCIRPVFVVHDNTINLDRDILNKIKDTNNTLNWNHLVGGFINDDQRIPYDDNDSNYYFEFNTKDGKKYSISSENEVKNIITSYEILETNQGIIEYIDCEESDNAMIAVNPSDLKSKQDKYTYCEINPALILGVLCNNEPFISMQQAPRALYGSTHGKQSLGLFATNYRNRFDVKSLVLNYPQKPIIKTRMSKYIFTDELPHGINAIVAIGSYSGYNQEDSIIFNLDSVKRGLFRSVKYRSYSFREEIGTTVNEKIVNPNPETTLNLKPGDYSKLDSNGIIKVDSKINENDILVGKIYSIGEKDSKGTILHYDNSEYVKKNEDGFIDRVYSNLGNDEQRYCKIRTRKDKIPEIGDKFASRHGQKGTIGMLLPSHDLPRTKDGIVPDLIVNPHAFPSRMTMAQFTELLLGKICINTGYNSEISSFSYVNIDNIKEMLGKLNFSEEGNENLYSGITGEMLDCTMFIGPTYYQRLSHQVSDKIQSRDHGAFTALTQQPVGGRALGGGCRIGEMERDCLLSHGSSTFLKESFMDRSDRYRFWISTKSGLITAVNPNKKIYKDLSCDQSKQFVQNNVINKKITEPSKSEFVCVEAPFAFKLFIQELEASGIAIRLISELIIKNWYNTKTSKDNLITIPDDYLQILKPIKLKKQVGEIMKSFYINYFQIKQLLLMGAISDKFGKSSNILDTSLSLGVSINNINQHFLLFDKSGYTNVNLVGNKIKNDYTIPEDTSAIYNVHSFDITKSIQLSNNKYESKHDVLSSFDQIDKLFVSEQFLVTYFKNMSLCLNDNANLIITTLDGNLLYKKIIEIGKKSIFYKLKSDVFVRISPSETLKKFMENNLELPNDNCFGKEININIADQLFINTYLANPSMIITIAKRFGFSLLDNKDLTKFNKTNIFKSSTDSCDRILNSTIGSLSYGLKQLLGLHKYFIFKKIPIKTYLSKDECNLINKYVSNINFVNLLPFYNQQHNILKGNFNNFSDGLLTRRQCYHEIELKNRLLGYYKTQINYHELLEKSSDFIKKFMIKNFDEKISNLVYNYNENSLSNTLNYINSFVKVGIYVKFSNKSLFKFVPIVNISGKSKFLEQINLEKFKLNAEQIDKKRKVMLNGENFFNFSDNADLNSIELMNFYLEELIFKGNDNFDNEILLDYNNAIIGIHIIKKLISFYYTYSILFKKISDKIADSEFMINVLDNPIIETNNDNLMKIPVRHVDKIINIDKDFKVHNIIPVFSNYTNNSYCDLPIPDVVSIQHMLNNTNETLNNFPDKNACGSDKRQIPNFEKATQNFPANSPETVINLILVFNYNRLDDPESDVRLWLKNNLEFYKAKFNNSNVNLYIYFTLVNTCDVVFPNYLTNSETEGIHIDYIENTIDDAKNLNNIDELDDEISDKENELKVTSSEKLSKELKISQEKREKLMKTQYNFEEEIGEISELTGNIFYKDNKCYLEVDDEEVLLNGIIYVSTNLGYDNLLTECLSYYLPTIIINQADKSVKRNIWYEDQFLPYLTDVSKGNVYMLNKEDIVTDKESLATFNMEDTINNIRNYCLSLEVRQNMYRLCQNIFSENNICNYMIYSFNKIHSLRSKKQNELSPNKVFDTHIVDNLNMPSSKVRFLLGKGNKLLLEKLYDVNLSTRYTDDISQVNINISGYVSNVQVMKGIINHYINSTETYIYIRKGHVFTKIFGEKGSGFDKLKDANKILLIQKEKVTDKNQFELVTILGEQKNTQKCIKDIQELAQRNRARIPYDQDLVILPEEEEYEKIKDLLDSFLKKEPPILEKTLSMDNIYTKHLIIIPKCNIYNIPESTYNTKFNTFITLLTDNLKISLDKISKELGEKHTYEILVIEQDDLILEDKHLSLIPIEYRTQIPDTSSYKLNVSKSNLWNLALNTSQYRFLSTNIGTGTEYDVNGNVIFNDQMLIPSTDYIKKHYFKLLNFNNLRFSQIDPNNDISNLIVSSKLIRTGLLSEPPINELDMSVHKYCNLTYENVSESYANITPELQLNSIDITNNYVLTTEFICDILTASDKKQNLEYRNIKETLSNIAITEKSKSSNETSQEDIKSSISRASNIGPRGVDNTPSWMKSSDGGGPKLDESPSSLKNIDYPDVKKIFSFFYNRYVVTTNYQKFGSLEITYYKFKINYVILPVSVDFIDKYLLSLEKTQKIENKIMKFLHDYFEVNYPLKVIRNQNIIEKIILEDITMYIPMFIFNLLQQLLINISKINDSTTIDDSGKKIGADFHKNIGIQVIKKENKNIDLVIYLRQQSLQEVNPLSIIKDLKDMISEFEKDYHINTTKLDKSISSIENFINPFSIGGYKLFNIEQNYLGFEKYNLSTLVQTYKDELKTSLEEGEEGEIIEIYETFKHITPEINTWQTDNLSVSINNPKEIGTLTNLVIVNNILISYDRYGNLYFYSIDSNTLIDKLDKRIDLLEILYFYFKNRNYKF